MRSRARPCRQPTLEFAEHHKEDDNLADPPTDAVRKLKYVSMGRRAQAQQP